MGERFFIWLWLAFAVLLALEVFRDYLRQRGVAPKWSWRTQLGYFARGIAVVVFASAFAARAIAIVMGWLFAPAINFGLFA